MPDSPQDFHKKVLGRKGEDIAAEYLVRQGCRIVKRNFKTPFGEADIIAADGDELIFVEVKTRTSDNFGTPSEAVGKEKRRRYISISKFYWMMTGDEPNVRFDVISVYADGRVEWLKNAYY